jgi:2-haloacid dehalogenase
MLNFDDFQVLTFDCYGTLIDWETGIWQALLPIFDSHMISIPVDDALELYGALEAEAEASEYKNYKSILRTTLQGMGERLGFTPTSAELEDFSHSVSNWPAFSDSAPALQALQTRYKLAILSNVDDDLFAHSAQRLGVAFDWVITAQQIGAYKPSLTNFHFALKRIGLPQAEILHVAQSLFHDIAPAKALGLSAVWINRRHDKSGRGATPPAQAQPDAEFPSLRALAEAMGLTVAVASS